MGRIEPKDIQFLREIYERSPSVCAVLDYFAAKARPSQKTTVDLLIANLAKGGRHANRGTVVLFFKNLQKRGWGQFIAGRHGHPSRFEWSVSNTSLGRVATGEESEIEEIGEHAGEEESSESNIEHSFQLRLDIRVKLLLPASLTQLEASRLGDFIKTLPFGN